MDATKTRLTNWSVKWKQAGAGSAFDFGGVDNVKPNIKIVTKDVKIGTTGAAVLGKRIVSLTGTVSAELREIDLTTLQKLMPWFTSGSIPLIPATVHKDMYDYAGLLTLHPDDLAADVLTQDLNLLKAVPTFTPMDGDGENDNFILAEWEFFPDRAQLPSLNYGYVGAVPA